MSLKIQFGMATDIGGGRENQDECFVWSKKDVGATVACVLDGHGREVGRIASTAAKSSLLALLDDNYQSLLEDPIKFLVDAHATAHEHIRQKFKVELEGQGYEVRVSEEGYLMKRRPPSDYWACVHGGTSCSIIAMIKSTLYIANVGDSTGILSSATPVLEQSMLEYELEAATVKVPRSARLNNNMSEGKEGSRDCYLVVTAEHSPESPYEFYRLRDFRGREDGRHPALNVVYDSSTHDKQKCSPVFQVDQEGFAAVTNRGSYYKNVRKEWASLISTPPQARYQDALAFTRSLGDLHLHTYGVTHQPEVQRIDLHRIFDTLPVRTSPTPGPPSLSDGTICLVLCTDGVWDNWVYEDVAKFVMDKSCVSALAAPTADGAQRVATAFMQRNMMFAKRNFGSQADNATGILLYISCLEEFPSV